MEQYIGLCTELAGMAFVVGFGGSIIVVSLAGVIVSGIRALLKLGGGGK